MQTEVQLSVDLDEWSYSVHVSYALVNTHITRPIPDRATSRLYAYGWRILLVDIGHEKVIIPKELFQMLEQEIVRCQVSLKKECYA